MVKRALTLLTSILIALHLLMPFNIYGATWGDAPIIGINVYAIDYDYNQVPMRTSIITDTNQTRWHCASSHSSMGCQTWVSENTDGNTTSSITGNLYTQTYHDVTAVLYKYEIVFDKSYVGRIHINWTNTSTTTVFSRYLYVNGDSVEFSSTVYSSSFSIDSYQLEYSPEEFKNITKMYNFPIESYTFINQLYQMGLEIENSFDESYYTYPLFDLPTGTQIQSLWSDGTTSYNQVMIIGIDRNFYSEESLKNYLSLTNIKISSVTVISRKDYPRVGGKQFTIAKIEYNIESTSNGNYGSFTSLIELKILPIYNDLYNPSSKQHFISTDFALLYGLSNKMLDDIDKIANGTTASQSAVQTSDSANSQLQTESNTLFQQENGFKSDMQNAMHNVNNTFRLQDMGAKFVNSAQWVRTQFEMLTNNTPFASLITFSLITGLALILLGKVYR